ncbi:MAG: AAA family ATPase [Gemmatimonadaceae bacterium]
MADKRVEIIVFKRMLKTDLDVLQNAPVNEGHGHLALSKSVGQILIDLAGPSTAWTMEGPVGSSIITVSISAVPGQEALFPAQTLEIRRMGGKRDGEIKFDRQRESGLNPWTAPVRAQRPPEEQAFIFLLRDEDGNIHARYVSDLTNVPEALAARLRAQVERGSSGFIDLRSEGRVVLDDPLKARIIEALQAERNVIIYGPPGTGKTWLLQEVRRAFTEGVAPVLFDPDNLSQPFKQAEAERLLVPEVPLNKRKTDFVVFHQSSTYEAFVAGLRPLINEQGLLSYEVAVGPLIELADAAFEGAALLLIDEVNRGNTAEIFGEVITLLELDKRESLEAHLPYPPRESASVHDGRLRLPRNLFVLASMNSVDRAVAPLDSALRRRFRIIEVPPDMEFLRRKYQEINLTLTTDPDREEWGRLFRTTFSLLERINDYIGAFRGPDFRLGHAYLLPVFESGIGSTLRARRLASAFGERVMPQLVELFRDQPEVLRELLGGESNENRLFRSHEGTGRADENFGAGAELWLEPLAFPNADIEESIDVLKRVAGISPAETWPLPTADEPTLEDPETE